LRILRRSRPLLGPAPADALPAAASPATVFSMASPTPEALLLDAMLTELNKYRPLVPPPPLPPPPLPLSSLSLVSMVQRSVGLGARVGVETRGPFNVAELKGLRVEAVVRYYISSGTPNDVDAAIQVLTAQLLGDRDNLRAAGFLRLALKEISASENVATNAWRGSADFEVLFEFPFIDADGADSIIARIPIEINDEFGESTLVTDEMTRWDNESAPTLVLRGPASIDKLSALRFAPAAVPLGTVTLRRTFDGAVDPVPVHPDLASLLAAITDPNNPDLQGEVTFASLTDFMNEFSASGDPITLGDWDQDATPDTYDSLILTIDPALKLPNVADRFEIAYDLTPSLTDFVVVYLRAKR
jgi:hypothetical protein